jgi:excinuclease UvrABC nuclease subunit
MKHDFIKTQDRFKTYNQEFCLDPQSWLNFTSTLTFSWETVKFVESNKNRIPNCPGIYCFFVKPNIAGFQDNSYLMYIGKAGDNSSNTLQKRFMQYFYLQKTNKRPKLQWMLNKWKDHLYFNYFKVTDRRFNLGKIEENLNDAFLPPYNENDYSTEVKQTIKVLR